MAIELDDTSHMLPVREDGDNFVNDILNRIDIKLVHVLVAKSYNLQSIFVNM